MDSSIINNYSKTSTFDKFKHFSYKYYPRFSKISTVGVHLNQFLVLLYNYMHSLS